MQNRCKAANKKGKQCKGLIVPGEDFCKDHLNLKSRGTVRKTPFYQRGTFIIGGLVLSLLIAIYFGLLSPTKKDIEKLPTRDEVTALVQRSFQLEPFDKIQKAIGISPTEVGGGVIDLLEKASKAIDNWQLPVAESLYRTLVTLYPQIASYVLILPLHYLFKKNSMMH